MLCPLCHTKNRDNAKFCKGCGRTLPGEPVGVVGAVSSEQAGQARQTEPEGRTVVEQTPGTPPAEVQQPTSPAPAEANPDDPSLAPTQILTPQQMMAFHARRWQQEFEQQNQPQETEPVKQEPMDIADAPTMLFAPLGATPAPAPAPDISEMPTMLIAPQGEDETPEPAAPTEPVAEQPTVLANSAEPVNSSDAAHVETSEPGNGEKNTNNADNMENNEQTENDVAQHNNVTEPTASEQSPETTQTEEQTPPETPSQQETGEFPVLAVGTIVAGRYEITQILSEDEHEHLYEVVDHQGYQRCWNCGSDQNAEGDEYCIDCGAALRDAAYVMHEYPASENKDQESHVLRGNIVNTLVEQNHTYVVEQVQPDQNDFPNGVRLLAACDSDAGTVRRSEPNEDSTLVLLLERVHESISVPAGIFVMADGMGGHDAGQVASRTTIGTIADRIVHELLLPPLTAEKAGETPKKLEEDDILMLLQNAIQDANTTLCQMNQRDNTDMGSTLTGFMMIGEHAYIFNVGDSRTYMLRDEKLYQLTNDHSLVGQLVAGGLIEPEDVYTHPQRSQIYRSIGDKLNVQIDIFKQQVHPGDVLLSCSDGLWEMVRDPQITEILNNAPDPQTACSRLIEAANLNGGEDNISAVVVFVR